MRRGFNVYYDFFEIFREIRYEYLVNEIVNNEEIFCRENIFKYVRVEIYIFIIFDKLKYNIMVELFLVMSEILNVNFIFLGLFGFSLVFRNFFEFIFLLIGIELFNV